MGVCLIIEGVGTQDVVELVPQLNDPGLTRIDHVNKVERIYPFTLRSGSPIGHECYE
jgi:hypothetical protein